MTPREAAIALNLIPGLGPVRIMRLLQVFASPELILESPSSLLMEIPGVGAQLACRISSWRSTVNPYRELELADNAGAAVTTVFDDSYPSSLRALPDPPIVLYSWGNWTGTDAERSIAVVGSRMATHYGRLCARNISHDLAEAGVTVISGLARGVDTEAHTGAMDAEGRTIAVIGAGLNKLYPRENRNLAQRIADGHGAVVSEFPMDLPPSRTTFPMRNRIVSGWSCATLVVEASGRSGALITARTAAEQGRDVFCIPGPVDRHSSEINILCDRKFQKNLTFLIDNGDSFFDRLMRGLEMFFHTVQQIFSACRLIISIQHFQKCGFPRSVLSKECQNLACICLKRNIIQCFYTREIFTDVLKFQHTAHIAFLPFSLSF